MLRQFTERTFNLNEVFSSLSFLSAASFAILSSKDVS